MRKKLGDKMKSEVRKSLASALITAAAVAIAITWSNVVLEAFASAGIVKTITNGTWLNWGYLLMAAAVATAIFALIIVWLTKWCAK